MEHSLVVPDREIADRPGFCEPVRSEILLVFLPMIPFVKPYVQSADFKTGFINLTGAAFLNPGDFKIVEEPFGQDETGELAVVEHDEEYLSGDLPERLLFTRLEKAISYPFSTTEFFS